MEAKENVMTDYSCGNCGWWGWAYECDENECVECGSDRVGAITEEDFYTGNALCGKFWRGEQMRPE